jgi:hypothetical protein
MTTYGVTYGGSRNPRGYGIKPGRGLTRAYSMQPLPSLRPNGAGFQALNAAAPLDAISRVVQNGQSTFSSLAPKATAPTAPTASSASAVTTAPSPSFGSTDLSADAILNQIKAIGQRGVQDASSGALAGAKNDLIGYGGVDLPQSLKDLFANSSPSSDAILGDLPANSILAALNDAGTASAAAANPFSVKAQLSHAHDSNVHGIDQASNLSNLFYSSAHANQLGDEGKNYLGAQDQALQNLAGLLTGENNGVLSAINQAHGQYASELPNAYNRALAAAAASGSGDPTAGDPNAPPTPSDGTPPPPVAPGYVDASGARTSGIASLFQLLQRHAPHPSARSSRGGGGVSRVL